MRVITDMIYKRTVKEFFQQHILGVALLNKNEILLTNDTFLDILNIETNGKAILSVDLLLDKISEDDRTFMQKLLENIDGGGIANQGSITVSIESKEGKKRIFAADYSIIVVDGEFLLSLILKDITSRQMEIRDLRQRAKMYAAVMENKNQSVLLVDRDYHVIDFNHLAYTKMIDKFGLVLEKDIYLFREFSSASASTLQSYLNDGFAGKELHIEEEFHEHEHSFWFEISVIPILNEQNQIDTVALLALDITGRKLTELALQQSEKRFRMVLENAGVGIVTVNNEGHILYANRQFCSIVNYNLFELQEMNVFDIAVPGDKSETMKNFKLLQQGLTSVVTREKLMKRKDGRQIWVNLTVTRFDHNDSIPDSFVGVAEDISRRKETEIELVKSEKRFRDVFENASIGIYRSTAEGKVLLANLR
jgi:PAS domain S-box-containing protein